MQRCPIAKIREKRRIDVIGLFIGVNEPLNWTLRNGENSGREHWRKSPP